MFSLEPLRITSRLVAAQLSRMVSTIGEKVTAADAPGRELNLPTPPEKPEKFIQKSTRIAILGANTRTGQSLALLLKQNPLVSHMYLYDKASTVGMAADLKHIDTRCDVTGYVDKDLNLAIRNADIIVLLGVEKRHKDSMIGQRIKAEGPRLIQYARACCAFAPKAILIDCVTPVSVTLPLISEVYRRNHWYHPGRVIGSVALLQVRLNTLLANHQNLDPGSVHVPLLGGPDEDTVLPLFSRATPSPVPIAQTKVLINRFRRVEDDADASVRPRVKPDYCPSGNAFAINRLVTTAALGLLGDNAAISTVHVRSNFVNTCRHIVSHVKFGESGVTHNYGVPRLTKFELQLFERICLELEKREDFARDFLDMTSTSTPPVGLEDVDMTERAIMQSRSAAQASD